MASTSKGLSKAGQTQAEAAPREKTAYHALSHLGREPEPLSSDLRAAFLYPDLEFDAQALAAALNKAITGSEHPDPARPLAPDYREIRRLLSPLDRDQLSQVNTVLKQRWQYNLERLCEILPAVEAIGLRRLLTIVAAQRPIGEHVIPLEELAEMEDVTDLTQALGYAGQLCQAYRRMLQPSAASTHTPQKLLLLDAVTSDEFTSLSKEKEPLNLIRELERQFAAMVNRLWTPSVEQGYCLNIAEVQHLSKLTEAGQKLAALYEKDSPAASLASRIALPEWLRRSAPRLCSFFREMTASLEERILEKKCAILQSRLSPAQSNNPWENLAPAGD